MTRSKNFCLTSFAWNATIGSRNFYSGWYVSAQISVLWIFQPLRQTHFRFECPTPGPPAPPLLSPSYYVWYSSSDAVFKSWPRSMSHESLCFKHESIDPYVDLWSLISTFFNQRPLLRSVNTGTDSYHRRNLFFRAQTGLVSKSKHRI